MVEDVVCFTQLDLHCSTDVTVEVDQLTSLEGIQRGSTTQHSQQKPAIFTDLRWDSTLIVSWSANVTFQNTTRGEQDLWKKGDLTC